MHTFKRNLLIGYGVSLLLLIISSLASYISINNLLYSTDMVNHTNEVIKMLNDIIIPINNAESAQRGYLITNDRRFLNSYDEAREETLESLQKILVLISNDSRQQQDSRQLEALIEKRFNILQKVLEIRRQGQEIPKADFEEGRLVMVQLRTLVKQMNRQEELLLATRTSSLQRFSASTPPLIILASLLAILVTAISFFRVNTDFKKRLELQTELQEKDKMISKRLHLIEGISDQISTGNYSIRIDDEGTDALGNIAGSLNKMAESLDYSFTTMQNREWLQTGVASLNDLMIQEQDMQSLTQEALNFITEYSGSKAGAFYLVNSLGELELTSGYALNPGHQRSTLKLGEGMAGEAAKTSKRMELDGLVADDYTISFTAGDVKPKSVIALPVIYNQEVKGVIELSSMEHYTDTRKTFFDLATLYTGIAIHTAQSRQRVRELLNDKQKQAEELLAQHSELENINAELEAQAEKLQASEEELKVQQEELQQANQELEERSRLLEEKNEIIMERNLKIQAKAEELSLSTRYKSEFLANMSHELRTPLNSILLLSRLLTENHENNLSSDQIEYAQVIQNSGKGLLTLIDEILDLSKVEAGKMELEYSDVRVQNIVEEIQSLFQPIAHDKGVEFKVVQDADLPSVIETDRLRLVQILRNLISNALKFTKKGSVTFHLARQNSMLSFSVKDTGIGIPKEKQQTIFEAFQQADGSTRRQYGGTGLGLSISRELAKLLGGEIKLSSEVGAGSEFTLLVPLQNKAIPAKNATSGTVSTPAPQAQEVPSAPTSTDQTYTSSIIPPPVPDDRETVTEGDRVLLIVEDDTAFARSLLDYTRSKGYKGIVAVRGDEGIDLAKQYLPLGILLDVQLPVKSGWEVMDELKADPATRPIPVHMMSSYQVKTKSLTKGAVDFIDKPVAFEKLGEIFSKIEDALNRHPKKVLIVEENTKHAQALAYFLQNYNVVSEIRKSVGEGMEALHRNEVNCVILDMGVQTQQFYGHLEEVKKTPGFENIPIIIFTEKNLSHSEEMRIKQYADSIVIKTAHSYQRILDEVSLFLHLMEETKNEGKPSGNKRRLGKLGEVLTGKTVLIADDDVRNIFSLTKSLEKYGMRVVSALDGKEALNQLEANEKVDLVLMDMMMPEMDGYDSTRRIREIPKYRSLPVIAVTAKAMAGDREKCIAAGASDYITKPVDVDQLISLVRVWLYE